MTLWCKLFVVAMALFASQVSGQNKQVKISVTDCFGNTVLGAQVSVSTTFGTPSLPRPATEAGNGEYVVELPQSAMQGIATIQINAPGQPPYKAHKSLSGNSRISIALPGNQVPGQKAATTATGGGGGGGRNSDISSSGKTRDELYVPPSVSVTQTLDVDYLGLDNLAAGPSTWRGKLLVPTFISPYSLSTGATYIEDGVTKTVPNIFSSNQFLRDPASRLRTYKRLFWKILLQIDPESDAELREVSQPIETAAKIVGGIEKANTLLSAAKGFRKLNVVSSTSSRLAKQLGPSLGFVESVLNGSAAWDRAGVEMMLTYGALQAFQSARIDLLRSKLRSLSSPDPLLLEGFEEACRDIEAQRDKDQDAIKRAGQWKALGISGISSGAKALYGTMLGAALKAVFGASVTTTASSLLIPTTMVWQIERTGEAKDAQAALILLTTLDNDVLKPLSLQARSMSGSDRFLIEQMREYVSTICALAAGTYAFKGISTVEQSKQSRLWAIGSKYSQGHPHFDPSLLPPMGQSITDHIEPVAKQEAAEDVRSGKDGMVLVEGGEFEMGSNEYLVNATPIHRESVKSFYIDKFEVTVAQFRAFCDATGWSMPSAPQWGWHDDHPIVNVSWDDATAFACWVKKRLPTEVEWEYAARGGRKSRGYACSGGDNVWGVGWFATNAQGKTHPVGQKNANELGIYDMSGNVLEWCADWYDEDHPGSNSTQTPLSGQYRVLRGGSWHSFAVGLRSADRVRLDPSSRSDLVGFRCVEDK